MYRVYYPFMAKAVTSYPQVLGMQLPIVSKESAEKVRALGIRNVGIGNARWSSYWADPIAEYSRVSSLLTLTSAAGLTPSLTFFGSPEVASVTGKIDGALDRAYYQEFIRWMIMVIREFSLRDIQLWNEPDSPFVAPGHFGTWEDAAEFAKFALFVRESFDIAGLENVAISIGLMLPNNSFEWFAAAMKGGLGEAVDNINLHHYATYWKGATFNDLKDAGFPGGVKGRIGALKSFLQLYGVDGIGINVTETNLRLQTNAIPTPEYETMKGEWLGYIIPAAFSAGARLVSPYAFKSGWDGCDIDGLPAEQTIRSLALHYNLQGGHL